MGGARSRRKGCAGERELSNVLRRLFGWSAVRGQQRSGRDEQDVVVPELPGVLVECKRVEKLNLYAAMEKAVVDAKDRVPAIFHRKNRKPWLVTIRLEDLAQFVKEVNGAINGTELKEEVDGEIFVSHCECPTCVRKQGTEDASQADFAKGREARAD